MKKKYQVFVSSTYKDLVEERNSVMQCLLRMDCIPVGMEQFPASNMQQMDYIKMMLDDCDYYILILAGRYGSVDTDDVGFTEKEYDYAVSHGIPVISFLVKEIGKLPSERCESTDDGKIRLNKFRDKVSRSKLVSFYSDIGDLSASVAISVSKCIRDYPAVGWVRGNDMLVAKDITISNATIQLSSTTTVYANENYFGKFTFDYSNNNGRFTIGEGDYEFVTSWSKASDRSIHAYSDHVDAIARIKGPLNLQSELNGEFDFTSRNRTPNIGDAIVWRNKNGKYAVTKIIDIKDDTRGADHDELTCEYIVYK